MKTDAVEPLPSFVIRIRWHGRKAGGVFVGLRFNFPTDVLFDNGEVRRTLQINIGLILATLDMEFRGRLRAVYTKV